MPYTFAIIGGGLTATSALCQIVDQLTCMGENGRRLSLDLSIQLFEKRAIFGPGLPHNDQVVLPLHITNMCAEDMSVRPDQPSDFNDWAKQHPQERDRIRRNHESSAEEADCAVAHCHHYPRAVVGAYLKDRFTEAVEAAGKLGITIELHAGSEVIDLDEDEDRIRLTIRKAGDTSTGTCFVDGALLATGHWFETSGTKNYLPSPWPASRLLDAIPAGETVGVIGSSLSAIEVVLTLTSDGCFVRQPGGELMYMPSEHPRKLVLHSRNGLLPRVRGRVGRRRNLYLTCSNIRRLIERNPGRVTLAAVFELLDRELADAYGFPINWQEIADPKGGAVDILRQNIQRAKEGDGPEGELVWQTVLVEIFPAVRDLYLNLSLKERADFDRRFNTLFFMHVATQPLINGEKLLALMQAGIVSLIKLGSDYCFERLGADGPFEFTYTGPDGNQIRESFPVVVNACGQPRSVEANPAALMQNLLRKRFIQIEEYGQNNGTEHVPPYKTGSIVVDPETLRVVQPDETNSLKPDLQLYAVGAMTRGQMIDVSMAYGINRSTARVVEDLIRCFHGES